jgi:hypothetical protein
VSSVFWSCTQIFIPMKNSFWFMVVLFGLFLHGFTDLGSSCFFGLSLQSVSIWFMVHEQLLSVLVCFSATGLPPFGLVLSLPQQALTPIDFVLHLPFWSGRREPGCCTVLSAARSKPEFFSSFRTVYVSLLDLVHLPLPVSMVPCFAAVALVFTATCCALVFDSFSRDLLACSSCIPASIRPRDCISSFFTLARAADCCQLPISVSVWFRGKPALDFGCFGHRRSSSSGLCYVLVMVDLCSDLDQNPGSFSYTASVR